MKYGNIFLFSIPSTLSTGHVVEYFIKNSQNFYLFLMPLFHQEPLLKLFYYHQGKKIAEHRFRLYGGNNKLLRYSFMYLYYLYAVFFLLPRKTIIFATAPQYSFLNNLFNLIKSIKVVYLVGDYYPNHKELLRIYQALIHYYNKRLKYVVYCSPLVESILRTSQLKIDGNRSAWHYGIKHIKFVKQTQNNLLGYIGFLRNGQGWEIMFDTLKRNSKLRLEIIGEGPMLQNLKKTAFRIGLTQRIKFWGLVQKEKKIIAIVKRWQIGLAPYDPNPLNMTYYADPSKVKFYLEYKLPVIMTKITHMANELQKYHGGVCIDYNSYSLKQAIEKIQENYDYFLDGVDKLVDIYEYNTLYDKQFKFFRTIF